LRLRHVGAEVDVSREPADFAVAHGGPEAIRADAELSRVSNGERLFGKL
jgi:hypothetical protein